MKLLSLLRHASAAMTGSGDHDRPLDAQGLAEAAQIARRLRDSALPAPGLILASDARRTRQTAAALAAVFPQAVTGSDSALYLCHGAVMLDLAMATDERFSHLVLVGHNPAIGQLASDLGGQDDPLLQRGFAPATLAVFSCNGAAWLDLRPAHLRLERVLRP